jgi:hypothetical protein
MVSEAVGGDAMMGNEHRKVRKRRTGREAT